MWFESINSSSLTDTHWPPLPCVVASFSFVCCIVSAEGIRWKSIYGNWLHECTGLNGKCNVKVILAFAPATAGVYDAMLWIWCSTWCLCKLFLRANHFTLYRYSSHYSRDRHWMVSLHFFFIHIFSVNQIVSQYQFSCIIMALEVIVIGEGNGKCSARHTQNVSNRSKWHDFQFFSSASHRFFAFLRRTAS